MTTLKDIKNKKYYIKSIELKGFKGIKPIQNNKNIFYQEFEINKKDKDIILLYGENGRGKTTVLESLTPYPYMISRDIKKSIEYPAYKKITFINENTEIKCEIYWESEKETKGYIYINGEKLINTEKGNITEYNYMVEKIFLDFNKFKTSMFMEQDTLQIVKAKPSERAKIINNFSNMNFSHEDFKNKIMLKISTVQEKIKVHEKTIEDFKAYENRYVELKKFDKEDKEEQYREIIKQKKNVEEKLEKEKNKEIEFNFKSNEELKLQKEIGIYDKELLLKEIEVIKKDIENISKETEKINIIEKTNYLNLLQNNKNKLLEIKKEIIVLKEAIVKQQPEEIIKEHELEEIIKNYNYIMLIRDKIKELNKKRETVEEEIEKITIKEEEIKEPEEKIENLLIEKNSLEKDINKKKEVEKEIKKVKNELKDLSEEEITETKIKSIEKEINKREELQKELKELQETIKNVETLNEKEFKCKCCKSILNKEQLEEHKEELKKKLEVINIGRLAEGLYILNNELTKIKTLKINIKNLEIEMKKFDENLEKKLKTIEAKIGKTKELEENNNKIKKKQEKIKSKEDIEKELYEYERKNKMFSKLDISKEYEYYINVKEYINNKKRLHELKEELLKEKINEENLEEEIKHKEEEIKHKEEEIEKYQEKYKEKELLQNKLNYKEQEVKIIEEKTVKIKKLKEEIEKLQFNELLLRELKVQFENISKEKEKIEQEIQTYKNDFEYINKLMEKYIKEQEELKILKEEEYVLKKLKIYNDRIKKAQITNFFSGITETINEIIATEEGTLSNLRVSIIQKGNKNLNIETNTGLNNVEDISLLSGAEKSVVAKGISLALAKQHNFGVVYMDESDGKLSKKNKEQFFKTIEKTKKIINTNQIFVISHNEDLLLLADKIIEF